MNLGFIGTGNIATSVIKGLCTSNNDNLHINVSPRNKEKSLLLENLFQMVTRRESNQSVLDHSEVVFIALPPDRTEEILKGLSFSKKHRVVSLVPFLKHNELRNCVAPASKVSRAVPFPTVENHECPILLYNPDKTVSNICKLIGNPIPVSTESELQALWVLTGLIAPFYDLTETLSNWAQSQHVEASVANRYVMELFSSLTCYPRKNKAYDFTELKNEATTPNGLNFQALNIIKTNEANQAYRIAADALLKRFRKKATVTDNPEVNIRKANDEDLATLNEFQQGLIQYERSLTSTIKSGRIEYYNIQELIADDQSNVLVCTTSNDKIIASGYISIKEAVPYEKSDRFGYLGFLYVSPEYRGNGIINTLIQKLIHWATQKGVNDIRLDVYAANKSAIKAYEKFGFRSEQVEMRFNKN